MNSKVIKEAKQTLIVVPLLDRYTRISDSLQCMVGRWRKDADQYQTQVAEARTKNLPHNQMFSMMVCLRTCAKEVQQEIDVLNRLHQNLSIEL